MKKSINWKRVRLFLWLGLAYFAMWLTHELLNYPPPDDVRIVNNLWRIIYILVVHYLFFEFVVPWIKKKRRYLVYNILLGILALLLLVILCTSGLFAWRNFGVVLQIHTPLQEFKTFREGVKNVTGFGIMSIFFFGAASHIYNYVMLKKAAQQLQIEKQEAELNYLKAQTNPHFLFNTLNNIYALAKEKSDRAPESVMHLSKILRFMLYETSGAYITIEQEIKIMEDYIALEKLRYDETLRVNFKYQVENMKQLTPPLLLLPLVENAFKHGASETRSHPFVDIHLAMNKQQLQFAVKNSTDGKAEEKNMKPNIGLANLRRQLELLYKDFSLTISHDNSVFTAMLKIRLTSHV